MSYQNLYNHAKLAEAIALFKQLGEVKQHPEMLNVLNPQIVKWREGLYVMVLVGEVKKGKSSLLNALLDCEWLSPVADKIASSVPIQVVYGEKLRFFVHFLPDIDCNIPEPLEISAEELPVYATEQGLDEASSGNRTNQLAVDHICVQHPHRFLKNGLVIVDLPGLGGVFKHHARLVWQYLVPEMADHIAFVFDSTGTPFAEEEKNTIEALKTRELHRFMFVQTKTDCADPEKIQAWREINQRALAKLLDRPAEQLEYFAVSNVLKQAWLHSQQQDDLVESGFIELEDYLANHLLPAKKDWLAEPVFLALNEELYAIQQQIEAQLKIASEQSVEKSAQVAQAYQKQQQAYEDWNKNTFAQLKHELFEKLQTAKKEGVHRIQDDLDPTVLVQPIYREIDRICKSEGEVMQVAEAAKQHCIDTSLSTYRVIEREYCVAAETAFEEAMQRMKLTMPSPTIDAHSLYKQIDTGELKRRNKVMEYVQRGWSTVAVTTGLGGMVAGPIGAIVGAIVGVWKAFSETKERYKDVAMDRLKGILREAAGQMYKQANRAFGELCEDTEKAYSKRLDESALIRHNLLKENRDAAEKQCNDTKAESIETNQRLTQQKQAIALVKQVLMESQHQGAD